MRLAAALLVLLVAVGCATDTALELIDSKGQRVKVTWRGTQSEYVRADAIPAVPEPKPLTREDAINLMIDLSGDVGLGAELVVIAEQAKKHENKGAWLDSLRLATWFHEREERAKRSVEGVEGRAGRAFGELPKAPKE